MIKKVSREKPDSQQCTASLNAVGDALYVVGGKWKLRIIIALREGNKRFNDIQRTVSGISARVLSNELKQLEQNGFVTRKITDRGSVLIEYELTDYSETLEKVLESLREWGMMHRKK